WRTETLARITKSQAVNSQAVVLYTDSGDFSPGDRDQRISALRNLADKALVWAHDRAWTIDRPIWRDQALVDIAYAAAASAQFARGLEIARTIPQPEFRSEGLVRIAETQARRGLKSEATASYGEVARAVAAIRMEYPRIVQTGLLIDSLISTGRFDDARASGVLYPHDGVPHLALGAIAESQGGRGQADAAREWIAREAPPDRRERLLRRVEDGLIITIDALRNAALSNRGR